MKLNKLVEPRKDFRTIYQRKNGQLRALKVSNPTLAHKAKQRPMFPIAKDRDEPVE